MKLTYHNSTLSSPVLVIWLALFNSCGAGVNNNSEELSGDSFFRESGTSLNAIKSHSALQRTIYSEIIAYNYNDDFIIAVQRPNRENHRSLIAGELNTGDKSYKVFEQDADSILSHDPYYLRIFSSEINFWIIVNKTHKLVGPLTSNEYLLMRRQLNIPDKLKLNLTL